jgi:hypothetical protein
MIPAKDVIDFVLKSIRRTQDDEDIDLCWRMMNVAYFEIAEAWSWAALRRELSIGSGVDEGGIWLPSNLAGVDSVTGDKADEYPIFYDRDRAGVEATDSLYRYICYDPAEDPLLDADGAEIASGDDGTSSFDSAALGVLDHTGYYVKFGYELGLYLLTAAKTFTPKYWGPDLNGGHIEIRPRGTKKMKFIDAEEKYYSSKDMRLNYWIYPTPLYRDTDPIMLPSARPLMLRTLINMIGSVKHREQTADRYRKEYDNDALPEAKRMNPAPTKRLVPKDVKGAMFTMDQSMYTDR